MNRMPHGDYESIYMLTEELQRYTRTMGVYHQSYTLSLLTPTYYLSVSLETRHSNKITASLRLKWQGIRRDEIGDSESHS